MYIYMLCSTVNMVNHNRQYVCCVSPFRHHMTANFNYLNDPSAKYTFFTKPSTLNHGSLLAFREISLVKTIHLFCLF